MPQGGCLITRLHSYNVIPHALVPVEGYSDPMSNYYTVVMGSTGGSGRYLLLLR